MPMDYADWRVIVEKHSGGLHMFTDATTVRFWLREREAFATEYLEQCSYFNTKGDTENLAAWREAFSDRATSAIAAACELHAWLDERNLHR